MLFLPTQFAEDRRHFDGFFVGVHNLIQRQVPHGGRHPCLAGLCNRTGVDQPGVFCFVVAPFNAPAFGGGGVARVTHVGGVALVAEQGIDNLLAGAGQFLIGAEEQQWVLQWHQRQG